MSCSFILVIAQDKARSQHIARLMNIGIDGFDPRVVFQTADIQTPI